MHENDIIKAPLEEVERMFDTQDVMNSMAEEINSKAAAASGSFHNPREPYFPITQRPNTRRGRMRCRDYTLEVIAASRASHTDDGLMH